MTKGNLTIGSLSQDITITPNEIKGKYDGLRSSLSMFLYMTIRISGRTSLMNLQSVHAKLSLQKQNILLSDTFGVIDTTVSYRDENGERSGTGACLEFPLDDKTIHAVENYRDGGDVQLRIDFLFDAAYYEDIALVKGHPSWAFDYSKHERGDIQFTIPKSIWVEKIFPDLGFPGLKLVEIPLKHQRLQEAYEHIILEFTLAEKYFNQDDYNKCIAHCRSTLDALTRNLIKLKKNVKSETSFEWLTKIDESTLKWIDSLDKSLSSMGSKTHHAGQERDFTRREAESIYLVTLGLMNFIGQYAGK